MMNDIDQQSFDTYAAMERIQDFLMGGGWYSRPPNYTLIYYKVSYVWP